MRRSSALASGILFLTLALFAQSEHIPQAIWMTGLNPGEAPQKVQALTGRKPSPEDIVLWQEGRPLLLVKAGTPLPKDLPEGSTLTVMVKDASGRPAPGIALQWKLQGLPNLPEPFGRIQTDRKGEARLHLQPGSGAIVWIDDLRFLPMITPIAGGGTALDLVLVRSPLPVTAVRDPYGRLIAGANLTTLPLEAFKNLLGMARNRKELQKTFEGDTVGRISFPVNLKHACGCIRAEGYSLLNVPSLDTQRDRFFELQVAPHFAVSARDRDSGLPIKNLQWVVQAAPAQIPWLSFESKGLWANGRGTLVPSSYPCRITFSSQGYVPDVEELKDPPPSGSLNIEIIRGVRLAGRVVASDGRPIGGAFIRAGAFEDHVGVDAVKDGSFELPPVPRSMFPLTLTVYAEDYVTKEVPGFPASDNLSVTIVMDRGAEITGRIVDEDSRQPISKAKVFALANNQGEGYDDTSGEDGSFGIRGLAPDTYEVHFTAPGSVGKTRTVTIVGAEPHDLGDVGLSGHPKVTGHLVDKDGNAIVDGAEVHLDRYLGIPELRDSNGAKSLTGTVDEAGAFEIRGVPAGRYRLLAAAGDAKKVLKSVVVDQEDVDLGKLTLESSGSLHGTLQTRTVLDLSSWRISLLTQRFDLDPITTFSDETGAFSFEDLPPGVYRLAAYAPLHVLPDAMARIVIQASQDSQIVVPVGGVTVTAFVLIDGTPAPHATVTVSGISDEAFDGSMVVLITDSGQRTPLGLPAVTRTGITDSTGQVTLNEVEPGLAQVSLNLNGQYYKMTVTIPDNPQAPLSWNFSGLVLTGRVLAPDGTPVSGVMVSLAFQGVGVIPGNSEISDATGAFRFSGLGEGTVALSARTSNGASGSATLQLKADQPTAPVDLRLTSPPNPTGP